MHWEFIGHCFDGDHFEIEGYNVWEHTWHATGRKAAIKDPLYRQDFNFPIYELRPEDHPPIEFAAGEFSNNVWGFFKHKTG